MVKLLLISLSKYNDTSIEGDEEKELLNIFITEVSSILKKAEEIAKEKSTVYDGQTLNSLLHKLKGSIGIYMNIANESDKKYGENFLKKIKELEYQIKYKQNDIKNYIDDLNTIFREITKKIRKE